MLKMYSKHTVKTMEIHFVLYVCLCLEPCLCTCVVYMCLLLGLRVAGCLTAFSGGLLLSVSQSRGSTGTFHWYGSTFIKSCSTAREEYLAARLVGTCCRHGAP